MTLIFIHSIGIVSFFWTDDKHMAVKNSLDNLVDVPSRTGVMSQAQLRDIYNRQVLRKDKTIWDCPDRSVQIIWAPVFRLQL